METEFRDIVKNLEVEYYIVRSKNFKCRCGGKLNMSLQALGGDNKGMCDYYEFKCSDCSKIYSTKIYLSKTYLNKLHNFSQKILDKR